MSAHNNDRVMIAVTERAVRAMASCVSDGLGCLIIWAVTWARWGPAGLESVPS